MRAEPSDPRRQPWRPGLIEDWLPGDLLSRPEPPDDDVQEPDVIAGEEVSPLAAPREGLLELSERRGHLLRRLGLVAVDRNLSFFVFSFFKRFTQIRF